VISLLMWQIGELMHLVRLLAWQVSWLVYCGLIDWVV
jgi:hypothetical protein